MVSTLFQLFLLSGFDCSLCSGAYRYHWGHLILLTTTSGGVGLDGGHRRWPFASWSCNIVSHSPLPIFGGTLSDVDSPPPPQKCGLSLRANTYLEGAPPLLPHYARSTSLGCSMNAREKRKINVAWCRRAAWVVEGAGVCVRLFRHSNRGLITKGTIGSPVGKRPPFVKRVQNIWEVLRKC